MLMPRYAGGHDDQMKGLFKDCAVIAHWNERDWQGEVATCVRFNAGKFKDQYGIYNDYYGSCSGCDSWEDATDEDVRSMCVQLANSTLIFKSIDDVKEFLAAPMLNNNDWSSWRDAGSNLLIKINNGEID